MVPHTFSPSGQPGVTLAILVISLADSVQLISACCLTPFFDHTFAADPAVVDIAVADKDRVLFLYVAFQIGIADRAKAEEVFVLTVPIEVWTATKLVPIALSWNPPTWLEV